MSTRRVIYLLAVIAVVLLACAAVTMAQVKTETTAQSGTSTKQAMVERGEVVYVSGNDVIVRMESGEIRHVTVPDGATAVVDGRTITVKDLQPGMKLEKTITTTTTPKTVKTVRSGTGTVVNVVPPKYVTVRFEDNTVSQYTIPKGTTFTVNGQKLTAFDLKKGMKIAATRIVEVPTVEVSTGSQITGSAPPPPPPPPDVPILIAEKPPAPAPAPAAEPAPAAAPEPAPQALPKTGSPMPLIGALGLLFSAASLAIRLRRS